MSLLGGGLQALFGEILGGAYLAGRVFAQATVYAPDGSFTRGVAAAACKLQVDEATEQMQAAEGYTSSDRAIYVLRSTYAGTLDTDAEIAVDEGPYAGTRWKVASPITSDPGAAYWLVRGVRQKAAV